jgi:hypothetical protein
MLEHLYPRKPSASQPMSEVLQDIKAEFKRLRLTADVKLIGMHACIEIYTTTQNVKVSHPAIELLSLLQLYERTSESN